MNSVDAMNTANLILGFNPQIVATVIVAVCYLILFTEKLNRAVDDFFRYFNTAYGHSGN